MVNEALRKANAPENISILTVRKNISGNLLLTPSPNTPIPKLLAHLPLINEAARTVHPSLITPRLNEKWHKLAVHGIPTDIYPDTAKGMSLLQKEIERKHPIQLAQPPRYISQPEKREGKAASSVMIALRSVEDFQTLK
jgi:hypothetical protein